MLHTKSVGSWPASKSVGSWPACTISGGLGGGGFGGTRCAGAGADGGRIADASTAPPTFCVQFGIELHMLSRWLQRAPVCASLAECPTAQVVIVPSLVFHYFVTAGRFWSWLSCFKPEMVEAYWRRVAEAWSVPVGMQA
jgi:hypothetical protein